MQTAEPLHLSVDGFTPAACTDLDAQLGRGPTRGNVGLALSGGGTRAAVTALGTLRALDAWGLLQHIRVISAVSGAAWTTVPYSFLPPSFDEAAFLGQYVEDPRALRRRDLLTVAPTNGLYPFTCMQMSTPAVWLKALAGKPLGIEGHRLWIRIVGEGVLEPWGLASFDSLHRPTSFFAADAAEASALRAACVRLPSTAHVVRPGQRPLPLVHAALRVSDAAGESTLAPIHMTPRYAGILGTETGHIGGRTVGGGAIQAAGFGGRWSKGPAERPVLELERPFSLADMLGMASGFFADALADRGFDEINPRSLYFAPHWDPPAAEMAQVMDAGALECTGVAGLLAYPAIDAIIAAVNPPTRLEFKKGTVVVDRQIAALFGYREFDDELGWRRYDEPGGGNPDYAHSQVFAADEFFPLLERLGARHQAGDAAAVARTHTVVDNPRFAVVGGREVRVIWLVLADSAAWSDSLDPLVGLACKGGFPNISTAANSLPGPVAQMLAHYTGWMLGRQRREVEALFG